jgi:hypothetical protein
MKKTIPVLAFLGIAAAAYAAYRKNKSHKTVKIKTDDEDWGHFSDGSESDLPQQVDDRAKQSYRIQARLLAEGYGENDMLDLIHKVSFDTSDAMFAFVKNVKAKQYNLDEAGADNSVTVRLNMPATADAIYASILEVAEMAFSNHGSYRGFTRTSTDIE